MNYTTIAQMFLNTVSKHGSKEIFFYKKGNDWSSINGKTILYTVTDISNAILGEGLTKGDRVGIISNNSPKWAMADYGIICSGCVTVSIYPTLTPLQTEYIINDSKLKILFLENEDQLKKIVSIWDKCPSLNLIVMMNDSFADESDKVVKYSSFLDRGMNYRTENKDAFENVSNSIQEDDLLTLIYTSGTTGTPKGVMLTHKNLASNIKATIHMQQFNNNETFLSFLPLSHVFERMTGHFSAFSIGARTYYAESIETVADNMVEAKPTVVISVPRLYEKIHAKIINGLKTAPVIKRKLFFWALSVGRQASVQVRSGQPLPSSLKIKHAIAKKLIFNKVKGRFGGNLKYFVSGGAPLSGKLAEFFHSLGILIVEGYGLTETSPVLTCNSASAFKFGTVGKALNNVTIKIAEDGEIIAKAPSIMVGYYGKEEKTKEAIDSDGWFHTGDIGQIDEEGFLKITDRKKSLLVTSGGKNIAPAPLENSICNSIYVEQCIVIGDKRNFVTALIVPNIDAVKAYLGERGVNCPDINAMIDHDKVIDLFDREIDDSMADFAKFETVKKYKLLPDLWTIDKGEMTPSLKVVRKVVESNYQSIIDSMYNNNKQ